LSFYAQWADKQQKKCVSIIILCQPLNSVIPRILIIHWQTFRNFFCASRNNKFSW